MVASTKATTTRPRRFGIRPLVDHPRDQRPARQLTHRVGHRAGTQHPTSATRGQPQRRVAIVVLGDQLPTTEQHLDRPAPLTRVHSGRANLACRHGVLFVLVEPYPAAWPTPAWRLPVARAVTPASVRRARVAHGGRPSLT